MRRPRYTLRNERGIALILALMVLLVLTGLVLSYLSVSALEPQISRNLSDSARARYLAEAGIERGFNVVTKAPNWNTLLVGATGGNPWVAVAGLTNATIGAATSGGTFSVIVRNDNGAAHTPITGLTPRPCRRWTPTRPTKTTASSYCARRGRSPARAGRSRRPSRS